ncbi:hypothetical protein AOL_s00078g13 [Orbilia oligospora ATCC 24927]|uniref:Uncharacterized protein n=2 Tax=Orbilia oligospora TaxID=2813651 RepID=G1XAR6_ARTOA|nr:hypothetical protein AOL_s00078g13 [Orbilia oligospora ATCC 24927]EGX49524.1 hypothetical protein AOL_s00078g13 [Orbilia oligospora ATCC 24927]KAF3278742.1 hypothetical protein TWF970_004296 [Orbilia oligospora]
MDSRGKDESLNRPISTEHEDPFDGFDGVHFTKNSRAADGLAVVETENYIPTVTKEQRLSAADRGDLVYYPAPVPVMLNLPPKLVGSRPQNQAQAGIEEIRARRESLTSFRRSLVLKASQSKADASSLFDNILDATVASPVLSVVNHSVSNTKVPGNAGHTRSASKFSMSMPKNEEIAPTTSQGPTRRNVLSDSGDEAELHKETMRSSATGAHAVVGSGSMGNDVADSLPRASHYPHSSHDDTEEGREGEEFEDIQFVPATLLAELESRKSQQRARTNKTAMSKNARQMPTLLERDAIAEVKQQARKRGPVNLGWQGDHGAVDEEEDDVPLGVLFANKLSSRPAEVLRAPGLLAMREAEDNEPLRRRQERLKYSLGREPADNTPPTDAMDEKETLGQRRSRLQAAQKQRDNTSDKPQDQEVPEANGPPAVGSMSAVLNANPNTQRSYLAGQDPSSRGAPNSELPYGYQAQQQMHINFAGSQPLNRPPIHQGKHMLPYQQDSTGPMGKNRDYEFGIPFPYAPVNAEYLQHQQALLADQIERWRSSVW